MKAVITAGDVTASVWWARDKKSSDTLLMTASTATMAYRVSRGVIMVLASDLDKVYDAEDMREYLDTNEIIYAIEQELSCSQDVALLLVCAAIEMDAYGHANITEEFICPLLGEEMNDAWYARFHEAYLDLSLSF